MQTNCMCNTVNGNHAVSTIHDDIHISLFDRPFQYQTLHQPSTNALGIVLVSLDDTYVILNKMLH